MKHGIVHSIARTTLACNACRLLPPDARCPARCARNFVLSGWSSSFKHSRDAGLIPDELYVPFMHRAIATICARPECQVLVAIGVAGPDAYIGFIAGEPTERVVYYVFVKESQRQGGIARALFAELGIDPLSRFAYPCSTAMLTSYEGPRLQKKIPLAVRDRAVASFAKKQRHRSYAT